MDEEQLRMRVRAETQLPLVELMKIRAFLARAARRAIGEGEQAEARDLRAREGVRVRVREVVRVGVRVGADTHLGVAR